MKYWSIYKIDRNLHLQLETIPITLDYRNLFPLYKDYFDLDIILNRNKRVETYSQLCKDKAESVLSINSYSEFIRQRSIAVENFKKDAPLSEVTYLKSKGNSKELLNLRPFLRNSYASYWAFDAKVKDHPLVVRAPEELMETLKKCGEQNAETFDHFSDPIITFVYEREHNITPKINIKDRISDKVENRVKFFKLCDFLDEITWAEGYEDSKLAKFYWPYILYGLELQKSLIDDGLLSTRNPFEWLRADLSI